MEKEKKIEFAKYIISRFDSYFGGVNAKVGFYVTMNTFIILSTASAYTFFNDKIHISRIIVTLLITLVILALASISIALQAMHPFLKSGNSKKYSSLIFFGSVASMEQQEFIKHFDSADSEKIYSDMRNQIYQLARGLQASSDP